MVPLSQVFMPEKKTHEKVRNDIFRTESHWNARKKRFFKEKLHVAYSLCPLTLIPNRQQKLHTGDTKFKENKKNCSRKERFKTRKGYRSPGNVRKKNLLAGREEGKKTMGKRSDGVGRCCSSGSGCACERHKERKSTRKKGSCALGAAALYCRRPQSTFSGAVCLHDGGNGTAFATRLWNSLKSGGGEKKPSPLPPLPPPKINKNLPKFVTRLQNFVNENKIIHERNKRALRDFSSVFFKHTYLA